MSTADPASWNGLALVVGSGGIGTAVAATLRTRCPELTVLTTGRSGPPHQDLHLDLEDDDSLNALTSQLAAIDRPLRLVFNCSGRLHGPDLTPEKRLRQVDRRQLCEQFGINAIAPVLLAKAVESLLRRDQPFHFASLSARAGSITDNRSGGWYGYRAAKAAQNQLLRCLSIEWNAPPLATVSRFTLVRPTRPCPSLSMARAAGEAVPAAAVSRSSGGPAAAADP